MKVMDKNGPDCDEASLGEHDFKNSISFSKKTQIH